MSNPLQPHGLQHARFLLSSTMSQGSRKFMFIESVMVSSHLILCCPLLLLSVFSQHQCLSHWVDSLCSFQLQHHSFQWIFKFDFLEDWLVWFPCRPRDSQDSSPAPQFESSSSLALSLLCGPALTSIHDYWKNHSFCFFCFLCLFVCF